MSAFPIKSTNVLAWLLCSAAWLPVQAQIPTINPNGVVNAATGQSASSIPVTARGTIVSIFGNNLASVTLTANDFPLPTDLGGVKVLFGGIPAALLYVSPGQINAQVPFELPDVSVVDLTVQNASGSSAALKVTLLAQDPGIFAATASGAPIGSSHAVSAGESFTIWATGLGAVLPAVPSGQPGPSNPPGIVAIAPRVKVGGRQVVVEFAGLAPGQVIYQINATAPMDLAAPSTEVTVEDGVIPAVTGPPGPIGPSGANGTAGSPGPAGSTGSSGTSGARGGPGAAGPAGPIGATGPAGPIGATGATGPVGPIGPAGTIGANGAAGTAGINGTNGANGSPGAPGVAGPQGLTWQGAWSNATSYALKDGVQFNGTSYIALQAGIAQQPDSSPSFWGVLAQAGAAGAPGAAGSMAFADFFALMPPDNAATVAPGTDVSFPQDGPSSSGAITRSGPSTFNLSDIAVYQVMFQVSVSEAGQLILTLNGADLAYTVAGRATGTSQIVGTYLVSTSSINSILTVRNPAGNSTALTITPLAGGTRPVSAHLVIIQQGLTPP